jgi:hypothetical protein
MPSGRLDHLAFLEALAAKTSPFFALGHIEVVERAADLRFHLVELLGRDRI